VRLGVGLSAALLVASCHSAAVAPAPDREVAAAVPVDPTAWIGEVARSCALVASCVRPHDAARFGDPAACVDWWVTHVPGERDALHTCLLMAKTCAEVDACTHDRTDARAVAYCAAHPGTTTACDGARFVTCVADDRSASASVDCASLAAACGETRMPGGLLVRGCISTALCPEAAPPARCSDPHTVITCHDGTVERTLCHEGAHCEEHVEADGDRVASCVAPAHQRCETPGARYCASDRLVECEPRGHFGDVHVTDCAAQGMRCAGGGGNAACVSERAECAAGPARCEKDALVFCAAGMMTRVPCEKLGLARCDPDARGARAMCAAGSKPISPAPVSREGGT
jgi:hypothetical protein